MVTQFITTGDKVAMQDLRTLAIFVKVGQRLS